MPVNDSASPALDHLLRGLLSQRELNRLGLAVRRRVLERTRRGEGLFGVFPPYSPAYARLKDLADGLSSRTVTLSYGVRRKKGGGVEVNERDTMLTHLDHEARVDGDTGTVEVFFDQPRAERVAGYNQQDRPFFGVTEDDADAVNALVAEHVADLLRFRSLPE